MPNDITRSPMVGTTLTAADITSRQIREYGVAHPEHQKAVDAALYDNDQVAWVTIAKIIVGEK